MREVLVRSLENRARLVACLRDDRGIDDEVVAAPVVVTGSPRAGTSILHELLACNDGMRAPLAWEYWSPAPPPRPDARETDPRIPLADRDVRLTAALVPSFDGMHEQGARIPREDGSAMAVDLRSDLLGAHYRVPSYSDFLAADDLRTAYAWHRRVLRVLQRRFDAPTWVVKWPGHANHLPVMLETYPDARLVVCHRDPLAMLSSVTSLLATLRWAHSNHVDFPALAREQAEVFALQCDRLVEAKRSGVLDPARVADVRFDRLTADPVGTVAQVSEHLGLPSDDAARARVEALLASKPRGRHGGHEHDFAALGLDADELRARFAEYQECFEVPSG